MDLTQHLYRQRAFSRAAFGPGDRTKGVIEHIRKECIEVLADHEAKKQRYYLLEEWIDIAILAFDGAWRTGATPEEIVETLLRKQAKNENRDWPDWRTIPKDKPIEHIRGEHEA